MTTIDRIRQILLRDWDPLNVGQNPNLADEYDAYLGSIYRMVESRCTVDELMDYLHVIENDLGPNLPAEIRRSVAEKLLEDNCSG